VVNLTLGGGGMKRVVILLDSGSRSTCIDENLAKDLFQILLHFRKHKFAVTADISEMFLRIRLTEEDKRYHRFWWNDKIFQWTRTLFGNVSSPDISQKVLVTNAERFKVGNDLAYDTIVNSTYMDDTIRSLETEDECLNLVNQLLTIIAHADMTITKFYSNSPLVLNNLAKDKNKQLGPFSLKVKGFKARYDGRKRLILMLRLC
jgi:hypothetical protein